MKKGEGTTARDDPFTRNWRLVCHECGYEWPPNTAVSHEAKMACCLSKSINKVHVHDIDEPCDLCAEKLECELIMRFATPAEREDVRRSMHPGGAKAAVSKLWEKYGKEEVADQYSRVKLPANPRFEEPPRLSSEWAPPADRLPLQVGVDMSKVPDASVGVRGYVNEGSFELFSLSLIDHCSECGAKDLDKPGKMPDGRKCLHPYRLGGPLADWPMECPTCGEPYDPEAETFCSNAFHCCRRCTWKAGRVAEPCRRHR